MSKTAVVSEELAKKFVTEKETPYTRWVRDEGLDIISAHYVPDLHTVELKPWARREAKGVFINHEASRTSNDCYVCEIAPTKSLAPQRQLFEEMILVLDGDVAQTLGRMLHHEMNVKSDILAIDSVTLWDFDYIDLGRIRLPSMTVPPRMMTSNSWVPSAPRMKPVPVHTNPKDKSKAVNSTRGGME